MEILFFKLFHDQYKELILEVKSLAEKDPSGYRHHRKTKHLARVLNSIFKTIPKDPNHKNYKIGNTLGPCGRVYRRDKFERYRIFFRFSSKHKSIIYLWMNDDFSLRKTGGKRDPYVIFRKMIEGGRIPAKYSDLVVKSEKPDTDSNPSDFF